MMRVKTRDGRQFNIRLTKDQFEKLSYSKRTRSILEKRCVSMKEIALKAIERECDGGILSGAGQRERGLVGPSY